MQIHRIHTLFFSATGTTRTVVSTLSDYLSAQFDATVYSVNFTLPATREQEFHFTDNELVIIGLPVYAGRVPNVLLPFLTQNLHGLQTPVLPIVLYGNRSYDDALIELQVILRANGFLPVAAAALIGEHSFSRTLAAGRPDSADLQKLAEFAQSFAQKLLRENVPSSIPSSAQDSIRPYYTPRDRLGNPVNILKVKPVTDPARCKQCALCAQLCPMGSITAQDPAQINGICIKCCACVKKCPSAAKYFADENFLYHQNELELQFIRRAEPEFFL